MPNGNSEVSLTEHNPPYRWMWPSEWTWGNQTHIHRHKIPMSCC